MKLTIGKTVSALAVILTVGFFEYGRSPYSSAVAASDQTKAAAPSSKLVSLGFISGSWRTEFGGDQLEEYWSLPSGNSMMGVFRWIKGGRVWMNELLTIIDEGEHAVFRLKHFDARMVGWEEKAEALTMKLVRNEASEAVFEGTKGEQPLRFTYKKVGEGLLIRIESFRDGKPKTDEFTFHRAIDPKP